MRRLSRDVCSGVLALALVLPAIMITGCMARVSTGYRVYDPGYSDYHVWDNNEGGFYSRWEGETRRDHRDFKKRSANEQKQYWAWRHNQH